jgi:glycoprotein 3-alpha-L-fucosyltransferase
VTTERLRILKELLDLDTPIASFGKCLNTAKEPYPEIKDPKERKVKTLSDYKFHLTFENSHENGYITEKYWQALVAGTVPVVLGAPDIRNYQPNDNSILVVEEFKSTKELADEMMRLSRDDHAYQKMLEWKSKGPSDQFLSIVDDSSVSYYCRLCIKLADAYQEIKQEDFILIRERNTFYYKKIKPLKVKTIQSLKDEILKLFDHHVPTWLRDRPDKEFKKTKKLNIYRIVYSGVTFQEAFFGDSVDSDEKVSRMKLGTKLGKKRRKLKSAQKLFLLKLQIIHHHSIFLIIHGWIMKVYIFFI